jgi:hypothetical protein
LTLIALAATWEGFRVRHKMLNRFEQSITKDDSDPKALQQWEASHIIRLACAETVAWCGIGILLRMLVNGTFWQAWLFYAVGFVFAIGVDAEAASRACSSQPPLIQIANTPQVFLRL